ncbi:hypothetical protein BH09SUM1_BH09SUM1_26970 [soil metagenome]
MTSNNTPVPTQKRACVRTRIACGALAIALIGLLAASMQAPGMLWMAHIDVTQDDCFWLFASIPLLFLIAVFGGLFLRISRALYRFTMLAAALSVFGFLCAVGWRYTRETSMPISPTIAAAGGEEGAHRLFFFGDVGRDSDAEKNLAHHAAGLSAVEHPIKAVFLLGDNIYGSQPYAEAVEDRVFRPFDPIISLGVPLHAILGSHDYDGGYSEQELTEPKLGMEGRHYYRWSTPDKLVTVFALDTENIENDPAQYRWLRKEFAADDSRWRIIACHEPAFGSKINHGANRVLADLLEPLVKDPRGVSLIVNGENHFYERCKIAGSSAFDVTVGSSGRSDNVDWVSAPNPMQVSGNDKDPMVLCIDINAERILGRAMTQKGVVKDEFQIPPK